MVIYVINWPNRHSILFAKMKKYIYFRALWKETTENLKFTSYDLVLIAKTFEDMSS